MHILFHFLLLIILSVTLVGCSSLPHEKNIRILAQGLAESNTQKSATLLQHAKTMMKKSKSLELYAPSYYHLATKSYLKARMWSQEGRAADKVKSQAQLSIEFLNYGQKVKTIVLSKLTESHQHYQVLLDLQSANYFPEDFAAVKAHFIKLVKLVENRKIDQALEQEPKVIKKMRAVEVSTIDTIYLSHVEEKLQQAKDQDAENLLPKTFQKIINQLSDTRQFIRQNPALVLRIQELAQECLFSAQRLLTLAKQAKYLTLMDKQQIEQLILLQEKRLQRISLAFEQQDIRNLSFDEQSLKLAQRVINIKNKTAQEDVTVDEISKVELDNWKRTVVLQQAELRRLHRRINND